MRMNRLPRPGECCCWLAGGHGARAGADLEPGSNPASVEPPSVRLNFLPLSERRRDVSLRRLLGGVREVAQARAHTDRNACARVRVCRGLAVLG